MMGSGDELKGISGTTQLHVAQGRYKDTGISRSMMYGGWLLLLNFY